MVVVNVMQAIVHPFDGVPDVVLPIFLIFRINIYLFFIQ